MSFQLLKHLDSLNKSAFECLVCAIPNTMSTKKHTSHTPPPPPPPHAAHANYIFESGKNIDFGEFKVS